MESLRNYFPQTCYEIAKKISTEGGKVYMVGGCVRDALLGKSPKDFDFEVFNLGRSALEQCLKRNFGESEEVGKCFGVFKLKNYPNVDIALPRIERKVGPRHADFEVVSNPEMTLKEAAARRDFTINAILWDPQNDELVDPFGGVRDLKNHCLKHTSEQFSEDPLRVLRGTQFIGRFCLIPDQSTLNLCRTLTPECLSNERITEEFKKLFTQSIKPSLGFRFLQKIEWLRWFPPLQRLWEKYPAGWEKYLYTLDILASKVYENRFLLALFFTDYFCKKIGSQKEANSLLNLLCPEKSYRLTLAKQEKASMHFLRLLPKGTLEEWIDFFYELKRDDKILWQIVEILKEVTFTVKQKQELAHTLEMLRNFSLYPHTPKPLITGKVLIKLGIEPGKRFALILKRCFQHQIQEKWTNVSLAIPLVHTLVDKE